jgi:hypothetical protein
MNDIEVKLNKKYKVKLDGAMILAIMVSLLKSTEYIAGYKEGLFDDDGNAVPLEDMDDDVRLFAATTLAISDEATKIFGYGYIHSILTDGTTENHITN